MEKKLTLSILFSVLVFLSANGHQTAEVCTGDITLTTQAEVDAFSCTAISGTLYISGNDITDLSALSVLHSIGKGLEIYNCPALASLDGLESLTSITGRSLRLRISDNPALVNVNGLSSLRKFNWTSSAHISIMNNAVLENLEGLASLRGPANPQPYLFMDIKENPVLNCEYLIYFFQSIGLDMAQQLYDRGMLRIEDSCSFGGIFWSPLREWCTMGMMTLSTQAEVDAFHCTEVGDILKISGPDITDLRPLARLRKVGQNLIIENNPNLQSLDGLSSLDSIVGNNHIASLTIRNNASLQNIDGLSSLSYVGDVYSSNIIITDNPQLKNLDGLSSLRQMYFTRFGTLKINNNAALENIDGLINLRLRFWGYGLAMSIANNPTLTLCGGITPFLKGIEEYHLDVLLGTNQIVITGNGAGCTLEDVLPVRIPESCVTEMTLTSQAEVDAFDCTEVTGQLKISGEDITNLNALIQLRKVGGQLVIDNNPLLTSLSGLTGLDSIDGGLIINSNAVLTDVDGISSLRYLKGNRFDGLIITNNPTLLNLNGLSQLRNFGGSDGAPIYISNNTALESIGGLFTLRAPEATEGALFNISILGNTAITDCSSLYPFLQTLGETIRNRSEIRVNNSNYCTEPGLVGGYPYSETCRGNVTLTSQAEVDAFYCSDVEGTVTISGDDITNLNALRQLRRIGDGLVIENNPNLTSLVGLSSLDSINGGDPSGYIANLIIRNNAKLVDVDGLSSLSIIHAFYYIKLIISDNPSLQNLDGLSSLSKFDFVRGGTIDISNNATLKSVNGLSGLSLGDIELPNVLNFYVRNNPKLVLCDSLLPVLRTLDERDLNDLISRGQLEVIDNGEGCSLEDIMANGMPFVTNFSLGEFVFSDTLILDINYAGLIYHPLQANTYPNEVGSVAFIINGKIKLIDNTFPYRMSQYVLQLLPFGTHTIRTEVYSKRGARGVKGIGRTAVITIVNSAVVTDFQVVDRSGNVLMNLNDGDTINIEDPAFKAFSIRSGIQPSPVHHVNFRLNNKFWNNDYTYPYSINGDKQGRYHPWQPRLGKYTLKATPYSKTFLRMHAGQPLEIHFTVVSKPLGSGHRIASDKPASPQGSTQEMETMSVMLYPVPVGDQLFVVLTDNVEELTVTIKNTQGQLLYTKRFGGQELNNSGVNTSGLKPGVYLLQVLTSSVVSKTLKFIKK